MTDRINLDPSTLGDHDDPALADECPNCGLTSGHRKWCKFYDETELAVADPRAWLFGGLALAFTLIYLAALMQSCNGGMD